LVAPEIRLTSDCLKIHRRCGSPIKFQENNTTIENRQYNDSSIK
jgi:hypothetical protein